MFRVLQVEDDANMVRITKLMLESPPGSFNVDDVSMIKDARQKLQDSEYDVVLLDLHLPDGDGRILLQELNCRVPRMPVIIMSSMDDRKTVTELVRLGADDFIGKGSIESHVKFQIHIANVIGQRAKFREAFDALASCSEKMRVSSQNICLA